MSDTMVPQLVGTNLPVNVQANTMIPTDHEMTVYSTMAKQAVASNMYKGIGGEQGVVMIMLAARELGIPPMAALNGGLNIIQGKVEISARMMSSLIRRAGHSLTEKSSTETLCELVGRRGDNGDTMTISFSLDEAKQAGLVKAGGGWTKWPRDMLYARCLSRLARRLFADVIGVGYVEGEIGDSRGSNEVLRPSKDNDAIDVEVIDETKALHDFLVQFDTDEALMWAEYIKAIQSKQTISVSQIADKYKADPKAATDKFNLWVEKKKGTN